MKDDYALDNGRTVGIIGLGFVGLPLAFAFIHKGFRVIGVDLDITKIKQINEGRSYLQDIEDSEVSQVISTNKLIVSKDYKSLREVESIIICVPTPLTPQHTPDLSYLTDSCSRLFPLIKKDQLIVVESSTYPGTTDEVVRPMLERSQLKIGKDLFLAYSPERIDPGNKLPIERIPKVVSGITKQCLERVSELYNQVFDQIVPVSTTQAAETTKLLENSFRLINISFINEFAQICDVMGVDTWEVIEAASTKAYGIESQFIALAHQLNEAMPKYVLDLVKSQFHPTNSLAGVNILVYGVTFKKDTADVRESPAQALIQLLIKEGAQVTYHDPYIPSIRIGSLMLNSVKITEEMLQNVDCVVIHTDHTEIPLKDIVNYSPIVFDTRNATKGWKSKAKIIRLGGGH